MALSLSDQVPFFIALTTSFIISAMSHQPFENNLSLFLGMSWISFLFHPTVMTYVERPQYRYSLVRLMFLLDKKIQDYFKSSGKVIRLLVPLFFSLLMFGASTPLAILWCLLGIVLAFAIHYFYFKFTRR